MSLTRIVTGAIVALVTGLAAAQTHAPPVAPPARTNATVPVATGAA